MQRCPHAECAVWNGWKNVSTQAGRPGEQLMNEKLGIICYLASPNLNRAGSFFANIRNFPPKHELIVYSDYNYSKEWPMVYKLNGTVEVARSEKNRMAVNNLVFFAGLRIAANKRFTHVMILEHDARVNVAGWDDIIWQEFLSKNPDAIAGGTMVVFNPSSFNRKAAESFESLISSSSGKRLVPLAVCGTSHLAEQRPSSVFPNGALAIYRMDWLLKTFPEVLGTPQQYIELAKSARTWDYEIGLRLWNDFKESAYEKVVSLESIYSGYGNILCSEEERKQWLTDGKIVGVHQIKSDWPGPEKTNEIRFGSFGSKELMGNWDFKSSKPKVSLFIVTYAKDFPYLEYCLRSIKKFATGFCGVTILVPTKDVPALRLLLKQTAMEGVNVKHGYEWKDKGMLWHMAQVCRADEWCPNADYIAHWDADCIFTAPVTPETFFKDGKPLLRYEPFESLAKRHPGIWNWKIAAENALPFNVADEFMRGHPEVYAPDTYKKTRQLIEEKHKVSFNEYVRSCKNAYPQTFAEHPTLGAVAATCFSDSYSLSDCSRQSNPDKSSYPVVQFWSHSPPDKEQDIWIEGVKRTIIPAQYAEAILK